MYVNQQLAIVDHKHIDWESMKRLTEEAWPQLRAYSFSYPSFIHGYHNGIAEVQWQLIPDGRYWMDDDGYGMTSDIELNIYGFIDQEEPSKYWIIVTTINFMKVSLSQTRKWIILTDSILRNIVSTLKHRVPLKSM